MNRMSTAFMVGRLIAKDFRIGGKYLLVILPFYFAYGAVFFTLTDAYLLVSGAFIFFTAVGVLFLEYRHKSEILLSSLPLRRSAVVLGRYATSGAIIGAGMVICYAYGLLVSLVLPEPRSGLDPAEVIVGLSPFVLGTAVSVALFLPFYFRNGLGRGFLTFGLVMIGLFFAVSGIGAVVWLSGNGSLEGFSIPLLFRRAAAWISGAAEGIALSLMATAAVVVVSILLSIRFYERRDIP